MSTIADNWAEVTEDVRRAAEAAGRGADDITVVAVSKTHPAEAIAAAWEAGARHFGESYVQELGEKQAAVRELLGEDADSIRWHFVGRLQSNKVRQLEDVHLVHSVDRDSLLKEFSKRARKSGVVQDVLVQVNVGGETSKGGVAPEATCSFLDRCLGREGIVVRGLMTIPPLRDEAEQTRRDFAVLRKTLSGCPDELGERAAGVEILSMGMSADYELAIEEGSTMVRVGTAIFGPRRS